MEKAATTYREEHYMGKMAQVHWAGMGK
jgi:hypothetical protein